MTDPLGEEIDGSTPLTEEELEQLVPSYITLRYELNEAEYEPDEIAVRFHHRLVWIHPYPNDNGRHTRLATDLLLVGLGRLR